MNLRAKLMLVLVACTTVASVSVGALSYRSSAQQLTSQIDTSLQQATDASMRRPGRARRGLPPRLRAGPGDIVAQALEPDGTIRSTPGTAPLQVDPADLEVARAGEPGIESFRNAEYEGESVRLLTRSMGAGLGAVQAARSLAETDAVLAALRVKVMVVTLAVAALAALAGWIIAGRMTIGLRRLTEAAEHVARTGQLAIDVPQAGVDEAARLGGAFNAMLAALARSRADQQRLVQDAGHELRTPMTSLRTNIFALHRLEALAPQERAQVLSDLESETEELSRLIDEVIEVATDRREPEPLEEVDLGELASDVGARSASRTGRIVKVHSTGCRLILRPEAVRRAVRNLLDNAIKFSPGNEPIDVVVSSSDDPAAPTAGAVQNAEAVQMVSLQVMDRGPGFDPGEEHHVFDRFYRAAAARSEPGSGLGLSIVAEIVAAHGGRVFAANRSGGGAVVGFSLPTSGPRPS